MLFILKIENYSQVQKNSECLYSFFSDATQCEKVLSWKLQLPGSKSSRLGTYIRGQRNESIISARGHHYFCFAKNYHQKQTL